MKKTVFKQAGIVLVFFSLCELIFHLFLTHPAWIPDFGIETFRRYYNEWDRNIIQYNPATARYDRTLTYTLRPGKFRFSNHEFDNAFDVNSEGLRDTESRLEHPAILSLGDSFCMGWGVEAESTYTSKLGNLLGMSVLNGGISSYGTAREMILLRRLQPDSLEYLVIQYCSNDYDENRAWTSRSMSIADSSSWAARCRDHQSATRYYPFKYTVSITRILGRKFFGSDRYDHEHSEMKLKQVYAEEAGLFLQVLDSAGLSSSVHIIVFCLDNYNTTSHFFHALKEAMTRRNQAGGPAVSVLDASTVLTRDDYYRLDGHLHAGGHEKIAHLLVHHIRELAK